jgi:hypothetical protein
MTRAFVLLTALVLTGCVPSALAPVSSADGVGSGETIIVGRVELVPPLQKSEQRLTAIGTGSYQNLMLLLTGERDRPLPADPKIADYADRIEAPLGSHFFVRTRSTPFYIHGGIVLLDSATSRARFPGGLRVALKEGDRAVYIGTLRYHRNEFFDITDMQVVDEYAAANAEYRKKFGNGVPLSKALMTLPKSGPGNGKRVVLAPQLGR